MNPNPNPMYMPPPPPPSSGGGVKIPILFGAVIALLGANVYLFLQLDKTKTDVAGLKEAMTREISTVKETSNVTTATSRRYINELKDELEAARRQSAMAAGQAKVEAEKKAVELTAKLERETKAAQQQMASQITEVKQEASSANTKIAAVSTEVGSVKTEVANTKTELDKTIADLKRTRGDLGEQSGLIATNYKEFLALKALGDRNYFEFTLPKEKTARRVGDIMLQLKKADVKKNRFTVDLTFDDKKMEKKDKTLNEPLQFYTSKARQPYELVINSIGKDTISGYLATPKVQNAR
ncbi:MAG: hypothetical protein INH43_22420 [Acidobacteriaceae bacterium]|jgi:hypothetical protein|nr:hypothetical protein [Acidobacteriaceae bacterium]